MKDEEGFNREILSDVQAERTHLKALLLTMTKERDDQNANSIANAQEACYQYDRAKKAEAELASLREPVGSEAERELFKLADASTNWKLANLKRCADALIPFARLVRSKTAALKEAEANITKSVNTPYGAMVSHAEQLERALTVAEAKIAAWDRSWKSYRRVEEQKDPALRGRALDDARQLAYHAVIALEAQGAGTEKK